MIDIKLKCLWLFKMIGTIWLSENEWIDLNRIISVKIVILVTTSLCANK